MIGIGILAGLVIAKVNSAKKAFIAALQNDLRNYAQAQEIYHNQSGTYASDPSGLSSFALTTDVFVVESRGDGMGWLLRLGHPGTEVTCMLEVSASRTSDNKICCGEGVLVSFTVSNSTPSVDEEVEFDASEAVARMVSEARGLMPVLHAAVPDDEPTITWDFGDGSQLSGLAVSYAVVTHVYQDPGDYTARMTIVGRSGKIGRDEKVVSVSPAISNEPPTAHFTYDPPHLAAGEATTFTAVATDPDGDPLTYVCDFGDSETAEGQVVQKVYAAPGEYTVELVANDGKGETARHIETLEVLSPSA